MKRILTLLCLFVFAKVGFSQIAISAFLPNTAGTDAPYEYVQLIATENIDFSATPYTVVWLNNGTATVKGWVVGGNVSYAFNLTSGTVNKGDVFYVGGSGKLINGSGSTDISSLNWIRAINTASTAGDGFGNANASGSFGNGGGNADAVGVFSGVLTSADSTKKPIDCVFFGTGIGTAKVSSTAGYTVADNDLYNSSQGLFGEGTNTYLTFDAGGSLLIKMSGTFNTTNKTWTTARTWDTVRLSTTSAISDLNTKITLTSTDPTIIVNTAGFTNDFGLTYPNTPSSASNFVFEGSNLTDSLMISVNAPFEIRTGINAYASGTIKVPNSSGTITTTVLDVRFNPTSTGVFEDSIVFSSPGATDKKVYVKGTASNNPELSFKVTSFNVNEGVGSINLQIDISNANSNATTCSLSVVGGNATAGSDFTFTSPQVINFPANSSDSIVVNIPIINDNISETTETIWFALSNATNGAVFGANDSALVTITDNDYRKVNIADIRGVNANGVSDSLLKLYEITGVVYGENLRTSGFQFTLRDQTAGIGIFSPASAFGYTVAQGDSLTIRGRLSQFNGLAQLDFLDTIIFHQSNQPLRTPILITTLNENAESELVRMNNVTAKTGNWISGNQYVYYNGGADSVMVRLVPNTHKLIGKPKPTKAFSIIGIGGQFDASSPFTTGYQLFPRDSNDVIIPADSLSNFNLLTPANNSTVTIQGASTQTLDATWETPMPAQGLNPATYTFLLDVPTGNFSTPLASFPSNVGGSAPSVSLPYFQIITLMNAQGINVGQSISLQWTVRATTGTYSKFANQPFAITLVRERMNSVGNTTANPLAVYPNPANTDVLVEMPETINTIYVSTIEGKQVIALNHVNTFSTGVDVSMLETGIYMLTVETATGTYTQRLAIQR